LAIASDERRGSIVNALVYIAKCAPPVSVGINPMNWTVRELEEWAEATSEMNLDWVSVD